MKNQIIKVLVLQYVLGCIYLAIAGIWDATVLLSALIGCLAALVPKTYFSLRMLRTREDEDATQWLGFVYRSAIGKWVIMGAILMIAFKTNYPWDPGVLFAGFILIQLSGWITAFVLKGN